MFKNIWLIFRHTKMLIIKRRGQTMGEHYENNQTLQCDIRTYEAAIDGQ